MQGGESRGTFAFEPNVIPMIDILLVLLIIFMLMNIGERRVFELQLPLEDATRSAELPIVLEVRPGGVFAINQEVVRADDLANRLEGIFAGRPRKVLFIQGDPRVRYQDVTAAIDVARGAGVRAIGVTPKSTPQSP